MLLTLDTRFGVKEERGASILSISSVREGDGGEYVCQVTTKDGVREQRHILSVSGSSTDTYLVYIPITSVLQCPPPSLLSTSWSQSG